MRIVKVKIKNFRGVKESDLTLQNHCVIVGDNNTGKSTILEAIDLVLGPERLSRYPIIDEHDFYAGIYKSSSEESIKIEVELIIVDLSEEQLIRFKNHIEWFNTHNQKLLDGPPVENTDADGVIRALRVGFNGFYDEEEDDFTGSTFFLSPQNEDESFELFRSTDKRECGFLFLRTLRTGSRALSLEKGTLLDIILRLRELRPKMWEDVLSNLREVSVATDPESGITDILSEVQNAIRSFVPLEWAEDPHLKVSTLTRVELRKILTVFIGTGAKDSEGKEYGAPFQHQGTGTINTLVLSLLMMIAELKQSVIFAMEEPEIAIPPHTQKRIVSKVSGLAAQAIFTSHSPYVLEEFQPTQVLIVRRSEGILSGVSGNYPPTIKPKRYRDEFRRRFCEALLARRVMITEGRTEYDVFQIAARHLHSINPDKYSTIEALGIALINAETDSQVEPLGKFFKELGKTLYAVFDKQRPAVRLAIELVVDFPFECQEHGFEKLAIGQTSERVLRKYAKQIVDENEWPGHLTPKKPTPQMELEKVKDSLFDFFRHAKGSGDIADMLILCKEAEMPIFIRETLIAIKESVER